MIFIVAKKFWAHALNLEHAQNALWIFVDAYSLELYEVPLYGVQGKLHVDPGKPCRHHTVNLSRFCRMIRINQNPEWQDIESIRITTSGRERAREADTVANETITKLITKKKRKIKVQRSDKGNKNSKCNMLLLMTWHKWQSCACQLAQKLTMPKKDITWHTVTVSICIKERANDYNSKGVSVGRNMDVSTIPKHRKQKHSFRQSLDFEKLMSSPKWATVKAIWS